MSDAVEGEAAGEGHSRDSDHRVRVWCQEELSSSSSGLWKQDSGWTQKAGGMVGSDWLPKLQFSFHKNEPNSLFYKDYCEVKIC